MRQRDIKVGSQVIINCKDRAAFVKGCTKLNREITGIGSYSDTYMPQFHGKVGTVVEPKYMNCGNGYYVKVKFKSGESYYWPSPCLKAAVIPTPAVATSDVVNVDDIEKKLKLAKDSVASLEKALEKAKKEKEQSFSGKIKPGAVFKYDKGTTTHVVLICDHTKTKWRFGGLNNDMFTCYSNSEMTYTDLIEHLKRHNYTFIKQLDVKF